MSLAEQMQVFAIIPVELHDILFDFYALARKKTDISLQKWEEEYGYILRPLRTGPDASVFEEDPVGYLIHASRSVRYFPDRLFNNLHVLRLKRDDALTVKEFENLLEYVYYEDAEKLPLTRKMVRVFQGLIAASDPFISRKELAKRLRVTENSVKWHIAEMKRRFILYRLNEVNYYKLGLSRIYLFIKQFYDSVEPFDETPVKPLPCRYPFRTDSFPTGIAKQYVSYQMHIPPWNRRYDFLNECKQQVQLNGADFLTQEPDLFLATGRQIYYNLRDFDYTKGRWTINLRDLRFLISNSLMTGKLGVYPPYDFRFDVKRRQDKQDIIEFDSLDLQICEQFWYLEGYKNRFATTNSVAKALNIPYKEVARRVKRLRENHVINFYYWSTLGLSTAFTTLLISKDEFIVNNFLSILTQLPVSSVAILESLRDRHTRGVLCQTYLPREISLSDLFQKTFFAEEGVLGFCAQAFPTGSVAVPLPNYYDSERNWWKWDQISIPSPVPQPEEDPWNTMI